MNDTPQPEHVPIAIHFRQTETGSFGTKQLVYHCSCTPQTLAALSADWRQQTQASRSPLAAAVERDCDPQTYQVFDRDSRERVLMFRLSDVLFIG